MKSASNFFLPLLIGCLLTVSFLYPLILRLGTHLASREDGVFIAWTINHVSQTLRTGGNIFEAPIFYPFQDTLAYSDPFLTTALINIPLTTLTSNLVRLNNVHLLLGTVLSFWGMWLLANDLYKNRWAAVWAATIFTFSQLHLHYLVHLHTYLIAGLPFTIYFLNKWSHTSQPRFWALAFTTALMQALNAPMTAFFLFAVLGAWWWTQPDFRQQLNRHRLLVGIYGFVAVGILLLVYWPYFRVSHEFNYTRSIRDAAHFAHSLNRLWDPELVVLYAVGLGFLYWQRRSPLSWKELFFPIVTIVVGGVLMLGPALKLNDQTFKIFGLPIPLPYALLYYLVPGFKAFRATSRWITVLNFGLSLLIGGLVGRTASSKKISPVVMTISSGLLCFFFWWENFQLLRLYPIPLTIPTIYETVRAQPALVLAEFPVFSWRMHPYNALENDRLLTQAYHHKSMYNGVSGFTPPIREEHWDWLWQEFPSPATLDHLRNEGVELVLVHYDQYQLLHTTGYAYQHRQSPSPSDVRARLTQLGLSPVKCDQNKCLYLLYDKD